MSIIDNKIMNGENIMKENGIRKNLFLNALSNEWLDVNRNTFKRSTHQTYKYIVNKYIMNNRISQIPISDISITDIVVFSEELLSKNLSPKTVNNILLIVNYLIKYSNEVYKTQQIKIPFVKETKKEMRVLSKQEQRTLEKSLYNNMDIYKFATLIALYTGIRIGELCALKWCDISDSSIIISKSMNRLKGVNGKTSLVIDTPKTNSSNRTIPYPEFLNNIINNKRGNPDEYVLSTEKLNFVEPRLLQLKFSNIVENCSIENVTFHTLRHTFATRCIECGFDVKTLSEILGHADVKTTLNKYVHSSMDLKRENMNKLNQIAV